MSLVMSWAPLAGDWWRPCAPSSLQSRCSPTCCHGAGYLLGKAGVVKHAIITALAGQPTPTLAAFVDALKVDSEGGFGGERERGVSTTNR